MSPPSLELKAPQSLIKALLRTKRCFERRGEIAEPAVYTRRAEKLFQNILRAAEIDANGFTARFDDNSDTVTFAKDHVSGFRLMICASQTPIRSLAFEGWPSYFLAKNGKATLNVLGCTSNYWFAEMLTENTYGKAIAAVRYLAAHPNATSVEIDLMAGDYCQKVDVALKARRAAESVLRPKRKAP